MCSNYSDPAPTSITKRWDRKENKEIEISCPSIVAEYNTCMGGVDHSDMLISLYRTKFKTKRWYLKIMAHCIDICKVNAWLIYQRYCSQEEIPKNKQLSLLKFVYQVASALIRVGTVVNQLGRPPKCRSLELDVVRRTPSEPELIADIRFDNVNHWPEFRADKRKCRLCKTGQSRVFCKRCNICLCLRNARNCFTEYHTKQTHNWRAD